MTRLDNDFITSTENFDKLDVMELVACVQLEAYQREVYGDHVHRANVASMDTMHSHTATSGNHFRTGGWKEGQVLRETVMGEDLITVSNEQHLSRSRTGRDYRSVRLTNVSPTTQSTSTKAPVVAILTRRCGSAPTPSQAKVQNSGEDRSSSWSLRTIEGQLVYGSQPSGNGESDSRNAASQSCKSKSECSKCQEAIKTVHIETGHFVRTAKATKVKEDRVRRREKLEEKQHAKEQASCLARIGSRIQTTIQHQISTNRMKFLQIRAQASREARRLTMAMEEAETPHNMWNSGQSIIFGNGSSDLTFREEGIPILKNVRACQPRADCLAVKSISSHRPRQPLMSDDLSIGGLSSQLSQNRICESEDVTSTNFMTMNTNRLEGNSGETGRHFGCIDGRSRDWKPSEPADHHSHPSRPSRPKSAGSLPHPSRASRVRPSSPCHHLWAAHLQSEPAPAQASPPLVITPIRSKHKNIPVFHVPTTEMKYHSPNSHSRHSKGSSRDIGAIGNRFHVAVKIPVGVLRSPTPKSTTKAVLENQIEAIDSISITVSGVGGIGGSTGVIQDRHSPCTPLSMSSPVHKLSSTKSKPAQVPFGALPIF